MRVSVGIRTIITMNLLVIGLAVALGRLAGEVAARVVEERLASDLARNTSGFLRERNLPLTDDLMRYLSQMFGVEVATLRSKDGNVVCSSLPAAQTEDLRRQIANADSPVAVTIGGAAFRVDSHEITLNDPAGGTPARLRLCLVVPQKQFQEAHDKAVERVTAWALPAVAVATVLAVALSLTITRPIRKLADQVDRLSEAAAGGGAAAAAGGEDSSAGARPAGRLALKRGPSEVVRLAESFDRLLACLAQAQKQLAQSERLATLGRIAASVAHELRNPLSGIKMNLRVLRDELAPRDAADDPSTALPSPPLGAVSVSDESFRVILREIDRMDLYLEELLNLARPDGRPVVRDAAPPEVVPGSTAVRGPVRLDEVADSVVLLLEGRCRHEGVEVKREFDDVPPVRADGNQIRQVVMNLLINAIEAMPRGGVVRLGLKAAAEGRVRFSVADSGGGVAPGAADIFEPFVTTKPNSAGLGLHLCRQIVTDHGGKIGYDTSAAGAVFWLELPVTWPQRNPSW